MSTTKRLLAALALVLLGGTGAQARTWTVTPDGTGDAPTIQAAIDSCVYGDVVELACGTYTAVDGIGEDIWLVGERPVCFVMKEGVTVRSVSGDPACVTVDAQGQGGVAFCSGQSDGVIEGLTLTNGYATTVDGGNGGALYVSSANLVLRDCIVTGNRSPRYGGALFTSNANLEIIGCRIEDNEALEAGGAGFFAGHRLRVVDSTIADNRVPNEEEVFGGGGFCILGARPLTIERCEFTGNAIDQSGGGAIFDSNSSGTIAATIFAENSARWGGALSVQWSSDLTISDSTIADNTATVHGGGVSLASDSGIIHFINSDFATNAAPEAPEGFLYPASFVLFECCAMDLDSWVLMGDWLIDDTDCEVAIRGASWGRVKTMFR